MATESGRPGSVVEEGDVSTDGITAQTATAPDADVAEMSGEARPLIADAAAPEQAAEEPRAAVPVPEPLVPPPSADALLRRRLQDEPWGVKFFQMVRLLERLHPERKPVGLFVAPADEVVRFSANTSLSFPASEIQQYVEPGNKPGRLQVNFMGLSTLNGPLPHPYVELILTRAREKDFAVGEFFDLFNHRILSLFYRGWKKYRFFIAYEQSRGEDDPLTRCVYDLLGLGTAGMRHRMAIADEAAVYYAGILAQKRRSAQGLKQILQDYFSVPVALEQFTGTWNRLAPRDQTHMNDGTSAPERLGVGTILGDEVWDQQGTVTIRLGPLRLREYLDFLPGAPAHTQLSAWLKLYSRQELDFQVRLVLARDEVPEVRLSADEGEMARLGFGSWLKVKPFQNDADETMYRMQ